MLGRTLQFWIALGALALVAPTLGLPISAWHHHCDSDAEHGCCDALNARSADENSAGSCGLCELALGVVLVLPVDPPAEGPLAAQAAPAPSNETLYSSDHSIDRTRAPPILPS